MSFEEVLLSLRTWAHDSLFWYPMALSLLSGFIFWMFIEFLPRFLRKKRMIPIFQEDFSNLESSLASIFDVIMRHSEISPSDYQDQIVGGTLTKEEIKIGLSNKCFNETYLFDKNISGAMICVGAKLHASFKQIVATVDKIYINRSLLSPRNEILLNDILRKVSAYYPDTIKVFCNAITVVNENEFRPLVTSMVAETEFFCDLYQLYGEVQGYVFAKNRSSERNYLLNRERYLIYSGQFKKALKVIAVLKRRHPKDVSLVELYELYCSYKLQKREKFYRKIETYLSHRYYEGSLVSSRSILKLFMEDSVVLEIMKKYYSEEEVAYFFETVESEKDFHNLFLSENMSLLQYSISLDQRLRLL